MPSRITFSFIEHGRVIDVERTALSRGYSTCHSKLLFQYGGVFDALEILEFINTEIGTARELGGHLKPNVS
jgi:hypothetical protein